MKIGVITDTHFGCRNDSEVFYEAFNNFYSKTFFPTLEQENVEYVFHLGDLYDRRRYINFKTATETEKSFLNPLSERYGDKVIILSGNHDIYYRDVNEINSLDILLAKYPFKVLHDPVEMTFGSSNILFLPWICKSNEERTFKLLENPTATIAMGHLELAGYEMYAGITQEHGMSSDLFKNFKTVYSGHYHHKSTKGNITYLGASCEYNWSDYNDPRGFHIFDTETKQMKFYENPYTMFSILYYDDEKGLIDTRNVTNKYVKIVVMNKTDRLKFEKYLEGVYAQKPIDVVIIEETIIPDTPETKEEETEEIGEIKGTVTLINETVDGLKTNLPKEGIKDRMYQLYNEAIAIGAE